MKVVVLTTSYPRWEGDAAGRFVADAVEHVRATGVDVDVVHPGRFRHFGIAYGAGVVPNLRARPWKAALVPALLASFARAARAAARDADVVHAHWLPAGAVALAARKPVVVQLWGTDVEIARRMPHLARAVLRGAAVTVCASTALAREARRLGARDVRVIPSGVDIPERVHEPEHPPWVLFAGRLSREKGILELREAMEGLPYRLVVAGDGPLRARVPEAQGFVPHDRAAGLYRRAVGRRGALAARGLRRRMRGGHGPRPAGRRVRRSEGCVDLVEHETHRPPRRARRRPGASPRARAAARGRRAPPPLRRGGSPARARAARVARRHRRPRAGVRGRGRRAVSEELAGRRVLVDCRWLGRGGAGRVTAVLLRELGDRPPAGEWVLWGDPERLRGLAWPGAVVQPATDDPRRLFGQRATGRVPRNDVALYLHGIRPLVHGRSVTFVHDTIPLRWGGLPALRLAKRAFLRAVGRLSTRILTGSEVSRGAIRARPRRGARPS